MDNSTLERKHLCKDCDLGKEGNNIPKNRQDSIKAISPVDSDDANSIAMALKHKNENVRIEALFKLRNSLKSPASLDLVMGALKDRSEAVRQTALIVIEGTSVKISYDALLDSLSDPSNDVRLHAIGCLANCDDPRVMSKLFDTIEREDDFYCRQLASIILEKYGKDINDWKERLIDTLIKVINGGVEIVQNIIIARELISALAKINDVKIADILSKELKRRKKVAKYSAALLLAEIGDPRAIFPLIDLLNDRHNKERSCALSGLLDFGCHIKEGTAAGKLDGLSKNEQLRIIINSLKLVFLNDEDEGLSSSLNYTLFLRLLPKDEIEPFVESCLRHPSKKVRRFAIESDKCFIILKNEQRILALLSDDDAKIRAATIELIGNSGKKRLAKHLLNLVDFPKVVEKPRSKKSMKKMALNIEPHFTNTQIAVATALLKLGNIRGWTILSDSLFMPELDVFNKSSSFSLLAKHGDKDEIYNLCNRLINELSQDENFELLIDAAMFLYRHGSARGLNILAEGLIDGSWDISYDGSIRQYLAEELVEIGAPSEISGLFVSVLQNGSYFEEELFNLIVSYLTKWSVTNAITPLKKYVNNPLFGDKAKCAISALGQFKKPI